MNNIKTSVGIFDISMPSDIFQCKEKPEVISGEDNSITVKSCLTRVVINRQDSEEVIEPIVMASCMNPEIVNIFPITYKEMKEGIIISTAYKTVKVANADIKKVRTESYEPMLKKHSCIPCRNCGRC